MDGSTMEITEAMQIMRSWSMHHTITADRVVAAAECVAQYFGSTRLRSTARFASREKAADIARRIDWTPTCLQGQQRETIVWQVLNAGLCEDVT